MIDTKILKFLYLKKHDGDFHDVSVIFNVINFNNYNNEIEYSGNVETIPESQSNSNFTSKVINKLFKPSLNKDIIDKSVVALEENGYVIKNVKGYLPISALSPNDNPSDANNSICKITPKGIEYYENYQQKMNNKFFNYVTLIFSLIALIISVWAILLNKFNSN